MGMAFGEAKSWVDVNGRDSGRARLLLRPYSTFPQRKLTRSVPTLPEVRWDCTFDDGAYDKALQTLWSTYADLYVQEHDMDVSVEAFEEMDACQLPLCAAAYTLHPVTTGLRRVVWAHRRYDEWVRFKEPYASLVGFGFVKMTWFARKVVTGWDGPPRWHDLDARVSQAFAAQGMLWHLHWLPSSVVRHLHV